MIYFFIKGHDYQYPLYNLLRVFFPTEEIFNIERQEEFLGVGILLIVSLTGEQDNLYAETKLYINDDLVKTHIEDIKTIEIYSDNIEKDIKIGLRKSLFHILEEISQIKTSWGILTGIRPIKIVHDLIDKGLENHKIINVLKNEYKLDIDKAELSLVVGQRQRKYIYPIKDYKYSLYVSVPFCPTRCLYCSFPSLSISKYKSFIKEYIATLIYEINAVGKLMSGKNINNVYIGGGTPTAIPSENLQSIIQAIYMNFGEKNIKEFTVEAGRPDTITVKYLKMLSKNKIKRISINPQTMNNTTLKIIGRDHTVEDVLKSFYEARNMGFEWINMDLIVGLPGEGLKDIKNTLKQIQKLDPENLTIHTLALKTGSRLKSTLEKYPIQNQDILKSMFGETFKYANEMDLYAYYLYRQKRILGNLENIGYCKKDMECIYNISIMEEKETIIGVGMGAVSKIYFPKKDKIKRVPNFKNLNEYLNRKDEVIDRKYKALNIE